MKLLSSSAVVGDIVSRRVQIEDDVIFHGHCISIEDEIPFNSESDKFLQEKAIKNKVTLA